MNQLSKAATIMGQQGGKAGTGKAKARPSEWCRRSALTRWGTFQNRFWKNIDKNGPNGCWVWTGSTCKGYGVICRDGKRVYPHRVTFEMFVGPIPEGLCVLHKCDNPPCCNPEHLFAGTKQDNSVDCYKKGRNPRPRGSDHPYSKLKEYQILEIRSAYASGKSPKLLSQQYKVDAGHIIAVGKLRTWKHLK